MTRAAAGQRRPAADDRIDRDEVARQTIAAPAGDLCAFIVSDYKGARSRAGALIEAQLWHRGDAEFAAGGEAIPTRDEVAIAIDQDREIEAQTLEAVGDLPTSLVAVFAGWRGPA